MKLRNIIIIFIAIILTTCTYTYAVKDSEYTLQEDINYIETLDNIKNPERGFYSTAFLKLMPTGSKPTNSRANLVHLRVDIGNFSAAVNGVEDLEFTDDALNALDETLQNIKNNGGSVIIRFAYDGFNGHANLEPSLDMILKHISQLKPVFYKNEDVLAYVELGFFGPWGEMHTSKVSNVNNVSIAIDKMLEVVPETIKIGVRTPNYYAKWLEIDRKKLNENITQKGTKEYRVGLYNDGYLGSESDLGTFANREIEIEWLEKQAMHTFYGGEVVANYASGTPLNTVAYMSKEAFKTHTTYLNSEWNNNVINAWKDEIYNGEDNLYKGQSGYTYIANHLGYRFVLRKSEIVKNIEANDTIKIKLQIENVGFANLINDKKVTLVLEKDEKMYEIPVNVDATTWNSGEISNVDINANLPENIDLGTWNIYLRISQTGDMSIDNNYKCIQLANPDIWQESIGANYIGNVTITEITQDITEPEEVPDNNDNNNDNDNDNVQENDKIDKDENENEQQNENENLNNNKTDVENNDKVTENKDNNSTTNNNTNKNDNKTNNEKNITQKENNDTTIAKTELSKTGENNFIIILIVACIINIVFVSRKLKK